MQALWRDQADLPQFPALSGDYEAEVAIIGGGMAGILTAYLLRERGVEAVVLEADRVASGQTQNTTAKITSQHGLIYHKLMETMGEELARQYAKANEEAIASYRDIIAKENIDCHFEERDAYLYSLREMNPLVREAEAAAKLGIAASFTTQTELPFPVQGAVRFEGQAQFHPLLFLRSIVEGLSIFERTRVQTVEEDQLVTDKGTVRAKHIVFACHYPFLNAPGYYFMRMHQERSYVLALDHAMQVKGMYLGIDEDDGWSLRSAEGLLLFGGGNHRTGENRGGGKYNMLRKKAGELWPQSEERYHWSAQDCMTLDIVPYIGPYASSAPGWYVATGFEKWGMTSSMAAATILTNLICGGHSPNSEVFSPQRFTPGASAKNFLKEGGHAVRDLSREIFAPPRAVIEDLPMGHGGVVEVDGQKVGVYRDENGEAHVVSVRCPHLGCQLEWNPDEKSWDCPCHGSRFDFTGKLICGPAQEPIA
ncbi:FAD-dependent oxidoreductase [Zongyangia hominis]|nr:FAD-dependent oxidoreductase [Zongyangia hominis]